MKTVLQHLQAFDTPTVCNALEMIDRDRRNFGYTTDNMLAINGSIGSVCGLAKTSFCRSLRPSQKSAIQLKSERVEYYRYVHDGEYPKVAVMQDLDGAEAGRGPFWGEFNVRIHRAIGCIGIVTDGSVRDVANLPDDLLILGRGLRPSHANIHVCGFGSQVNVFGMVVNDGDVVHADIHGAVVFSATLAEKVAENAEAFMEGERPIIEACKANALSFDQLEKLYLSR